MKNIKICLFLLLAYNVSVKSQSKLTLYPNDFDEELKGLYDIKGDSLNFPFSFTKLMQLNKNLYFAQGYVTGPNLITKNRDIVKSLSEDFNGQVLDLKPAGHGMFIAEFIINNSNNSKDLRYGLLDSLGNWVIKPVHKSILPYEYGTAIIYGFNTQDSVGLIDKKGKIILPIAKRYIYAADIYGNRIVEEPKENTVNLVSRYIDVNAKTIGNVSPGILSYPLSEGLQFKYDYSISDRGYYDFNGKKLVQIGDGQIKQIGFFEDGYTFVIVGDNELRIFDKKGKATYSLKITEDTEVQNLGNGFFSIANKSTCNIINFAGKKLINEINTNGGNVWVYVFNKTYIGIKLNNHIYDINEPSKKKQSTILYDFDGRLIVDFKYEEINWIYKDVASVSYNILDEVLLNVATKIETRFPAYIKRTSFEKPNNNGLILLRTDLKNYKNLAVSDKLLFNVAKSADEINAENSELINGDIRRRNAKLLEGIEKHKRLMERYDEENRREKAAAEAKNRAQINATESERQRQYADGEKCVNCPNCSGTGSLWIIVVGGVSKKVDCDRCQGNKKIKKICDDNKSRTLEEQVKCICGT
jgi:hypothetical protein